jgi:hypothetical protein
MLVEWKYAGQEKSPGTCARASRKGIVERVYCSIMLSVGAALAQFSALHMRAISDFARPNSSAMS